MKLKSWCPKIVPISWSIFGKCEVVFSTSFAHVKFVRTLHFPFFFGTTTHLWATLDIILSWWIQFARTIHSFADNFGPTSTCMDVSSNKCAWMLDSYWDYYRPSEINFCHVSNWPTNNFPFCLRQFISSYLSLASRFFSIFVTILGSSSRKMSSQSYSPQQAPSKAYLSSYSLPPGGFELQLTSLESYCNFYVEAFPIVNGSRACGPNIFWILSLIWGCLSGTRSVMVSLCWVQGWPHHISSTAPGSSVSSLPLAAKGQSASYFLDCPRFFRFFITSCSKGAEHLIVCRGACS